MVQKIKLDDAEYKVENLSEQAQAYIVTLKFTDTRLQQLTDMRVLLQRAKNSYADSLKNEMLSSKAGFLFGDK